MTSRFAVAATLVAIVLPAAQTIEQTTPGSKSPAALVESFDGLGVGFEGPQGKYEGRNPSDNSLAVGPDHIVQTVNSRLAIFSRKGFKFDTSGRVLYGPVNTNTIFAGLGGPCEARNNGDAVVRYDQLANRWLVTMPIFSRIPLTEVGERPPIDRPAPPGQLAAPGQASSPGGAAALPANPPPPPPPQGRGQRGQAAAGGPPPPPPPPSTYAMCYAISTTADPMGPYYRYAFERPLFPDYPRPAVWIDGYYVPTSSSDDRISETVATQKHACVVDRARMLAGEPASEQCKVVLNVNFLNNADIDGPLTPPAGAPNIMMAAGGTQLDNIFEADTIDVWQFHVDWKTPANTKLVGPQKIKVAPYHYLCKGQLTNCVPQPETDRRLDAQGDKIMSRVVYRRIGSREAMVAVHSVNTSAGGGGVRWYELVIDARDRTRKVTLSQQGTYAPDGFYRWMASPAIDRFGNIGIGYSFGGTPHFAGQRFAGRERSDPAGVLTLKETILVEGEASQTTTLRWEDYTTTAIDPSDDCTVWYVGDYLKKGAASYSTRIGAFRMPGCGR